MEACGVGFCPADGHPLVRSLAQQVLNAKGGRGVARELADLLLQSRFDSLVDAYKPLFKKYLKAIPRD